MSANPAERERLQWEAYQRCVAAHNDRIERLETRVRELETENARLRKEGNDGRPRGSNGN